MGLPDFCTARAGRAIGLSTESAWANSPDEIRSFQSRPGRGAIRRRRATMETGGLAGSTALSPPRDAFGLALSALRLRLRQGVDAPGAALPINLIAEALRLSPTPVREALSRLAGEGLVDKKGPAYTRPNLDALALAELYDLRLLYLSAALAADGNRRARRRQRPPSEPTGFRAALAEDPDGHAGVVEAVYLEIVRHADDRMLALAYQNADERLAPFQPLEAQVLTNLVSEAFGIVTAFETSDLAALRAGVRTHHRRRRAVAELLTRLAAGAKYRPDMI